MCFASTQITSQSSRATTTYQEFSQTILSIQVQTTGDSGLTSGTACLIMFVPISARVASSCSRKGSNAVSTDIICFGETSI
jgi:c-di-GMP-binding flagellar brake protein YcgR